jgi:AP-3 complex subunit delta-1
MVLSPPAAPRCPASLCRCVATVVSLCVATPVLACAQEFQAKSPLQVGLAISCLANIATPELAQDLLSDVVTMLTRFVRCFSLWRGVCVCTCVDSPDDACLRSSKPYIRKKAVLVLYKLFLQFPQGLRLSFEALKRRLADEDTAVCVCVSVCLCLC